LLLAIPVETTKDLIAQINDHMMGIKGAFNKLRKFIWWWLNYVEKNPGYGVVVLLELKNKQELCIDGCLPGGKELLPNYSRHH